MNKKKQQTTPAEDSQNTRNPLNSSKTTSIDGLRTSMNGLGFGNSTGVSQTKSQNMARAGLDVSCCSNSKCKRHHLKRLGCVHECHGNTTFRITKGWVGEVVAEGKRERQTESGDARETKRPRSNNFTFNCTLTKDLTFVVNGYEELVLPPPTQVVINGVTYMQKK